MTNETPPCPWNVGDRVQRKPGSSYLFPGVIISTGLKLDGKTWHCEVECIAPGVEGCTHVFPASQLVPLDPEWNYRPTPDAAMRKALEEAREAITHRGGPLCSSRYYSNAECDCGAANAIAKIDAALAEAPADGGV